jgi:hypothetical protein
MRVGDRDRRDPAQRADERRRRGVGERDAVPQQVAALGAQQQRALTDGEGRLGADADHAGLVFAIAVEMGRRERRQRRPGLSAGGTYWRSSSQIGQCCGGASLGANCAPHAAQMKAGIQGLLIGRWSETSLRRPFPRKRSENGERDDSKDSSGDNRPGFGSLPRLRGQRGCNSSA